MKLLDHYKGLSKSIHHTNQTVDLTIAKMATLLSCSERNAKLLIRRMQKLDWITWQPGKGRGHSSKIKLLKSVDELVQEEAKKLAESGLIDAAIHLIQHQPNTNHQAFVSWLSNYLHKTDLIFEKDHLRFPSYRPIPILDPAYVNRRTENHIMLHLFNRLITYNEETKTFQGDLAHNWIVNGTEEIWTFYLRKGIYFHNGMTCTSHEIKNHFLHLPSSSPVYWGIKNLATIHCPNLYTCEFQFHKPSPYFLHVASSIPILHEKGTRSHPIGTGPFRITKNSEKQLRLSAFDHYFGKRPLLDDVTMYFFPNLYDNQPAYELSGDNRLNFYPYPYHLESTINLQQFERIDRGCKMISMNARTNTPLSDKSFRKALYHLLDPLDLIEATGGNRFIPATRLMQSTEESTIKQRNRKEGKRLLKHCSYDGQTLFLLSYAGAGNEEDATWMKRRLKEEGVSIEVIILPYKELTHQKKKTADLLLGEQLVYKDPCYTYLSAILDRHGMLYYHHQKIAEQVESLIENSDLDIDLLSSLKQAEHNLCSNYYALPLYRLKQYAIYPSYVENVTLNTFGWVNYTKLWYKR
ncbi:ABC transporter substrate-binding protein [Bacillus sp. JCM 19041]|uniref:ABC transporter substrate-binding protein n=1 Tax=Bacillus sp. JCM 19041 TaxID=1460637 RepID=UPI0006D2A392